MVVRSSISKSEYARRYDEYASKLYYFALRVTGDELLSRRAMSELFTEGYCRCKEDSFLADMVAVLWQILESCQPEQQRFTASVLPPLRNLTLLCRAAVLMRIVFPIAEKEIADILKLSETELFEMYSKMKSGAAAAV